MSWSVHTGALYTSDSSSVVLCWTGVFGLPNSFDCQIVDLPPGEYVASAEDCASGRFCFVGLAGDELQPPSSFAGGGSGAASSPSQAASVALVPFEFTPAQQGEIYGAMALVFGVTLGAMALIWGGKRILRVLDQYGGAE